MGLMAWSPLAGGILFRSSNVQQGGKALKDALEAVGREIGANGIDQVSHPLHHS